MILTEKSRTAFKIQIQIEQTSLHKHLPKSQIPIRLQLKPAFQYRSDLQQKPLGFVTIHPPTKTKVCVNCSIGPLDKRSVYQCTHQGQCD